MAQVFGQLHPPRRAAPERQCRIQIVRAFADPAPQRFAAGLFECLHHPLAVFEGDYVPARGAEHPVDQAEHLIGHDAIQALSVVVDDPPAIAKAVLPTLPKSFVHVAFVHFRITDERHHAAGIARCDGIAVAA